MTVAGHARHRNTTRWKVVARKRGKTPPMQRVMPDSNSPEAERRVQPPLSKLFVFSCLLLGLAIVGIHRLLTALPDRIPRPPGMTRLLFTPIAKPSDWRPLKLAGRWQLASDEPRFGGLSALQLDGEGFVALSDAGTAISFPRPGKGHTANLVDLPSGPGGDSRKSGRDSESLASDPGGRGWWIGFENGHQLRLFDRSFQRTLATVSLRRLHWPANRGAEGVATNRGTLRIFPESGSEWVAIDDSIRRHQIAGGIGRVGDVVQLRGALLLALARTISPLGVSSRLMISRDDGATWTVLAHLPLGRLSNPEGIAAETRPHGGYRLWIVTDNDFRRRVPTELIALDWNP